MVGHHWAKKPLSENHINLMVSHRFNKINGTIISRWSNQINSMVKIKDSDELKKSVKQKGAQLNTRSVIADCSNSINNRRY
jgi:hypothetical protein